jgi:predicted metal-binding membrane protein
MDMAPVAAAWTPMQWALLVGMWWTMMVAMMAPSAAPVVLLYARAQRHAMQAPAAGAAATGGGFAIPWPIAAFALGYAVAWLVFSLVAAAAQQLLQHRQWLSPSTMGVSFDGLSATMLIAAGAYQLSPLKGACLSQCRSPAAFLARHWRPGATGAIRLGLLHGAYCVGCCWLLMALLFVGGVMNPWWIVALALVVLAEKYLPAGQWLGRVLGLVLVGWGLLLVLPDTL